MSTLHIAGYILFATAWGFAIGIWSERARARHANRAADLAIINRILAPDVKRRLRIMRGKKGQQ